MPIGGQGDDRRRGSRSRPGGARGGRRPARLLTGVRLARRGRGRRSSASGSAAARPFEARDRRVEVHRPGPPVRVRGQRRDGGLERAAAGGVVDEHVEAGRGRAEQDGRRAPAAPAARPARSRAMASAASDGRPRGRRRAPCGRGRPPGTRPRASGPLSPMRTAATARSATTGASARQVDALVAAAGDQHDRRRRTRGGRRRRRRAGSPANR